MFLNRFILNNILFRNKVIFAIGEIVYCRCFVRESSLVRCNRDVARFETGSWQCLPDRRTAQSCSCDLASNPAHDRVDSSIMDCYVQYPGTV